MIRGEPGGILETVVPGLPVEAGAAVGSISYLQYLVPTTDLIQTQ